MEDPQLIWASGETNKGEEKAEHNEKVSAEHNLIFFDVSTHHYLAACLKGSK